MNPHEHQERPQHPLANYQFSSEELRVFRECNVESFFQRSLPLGTAFGVAAYLGVQRGFLSSNIKYGAVPKVVVGVILGYFVGKFSYYRKCAEKVMALPNSRLGQIYRQQQNQSVGGFASLKPDQNISKGMALGQFTPNVTDVYSDEHLQPSSKGNALNLDTETRPTFVGLDDIYRPSLDNSTITQVDPDIPLDPVKPGMTYDELRKRNREAYMKQQENPFSRPLPPDAPVVTRQSLPPQRSSAEQEVPPKNTQRNKYGDAWIE